MNINFEVKKEAKVNETEVIKEMFYNSFKKDNSQKQNNDYLRVSQLTGECLRKAYYDFFDIPKKTMNEISYLKTSMGNLIHEYVQNHLKFVTYNEDYLVDNDLKLSGHIDGYSEQFNAIIEIKTVGMFPYIIRNMFNEPKKGHIHQTQRYINMFNNKYNHHVDKGFIVYVNRNIDVTLGTYDNIQNFIENVTFNKKMWINNGLDEFITIFPIKYNEKIIEEQNKTIGDFWNRVNFSKKPPPKISNKMICDNCIYLEFCRGSNVKKEKE